MFSKFWSWKPFGKRVPFRSAKVSLSDSCIDHILLSWHQTLQPLFRPGHDKHIGLPWVWTRRHGRCYHTCVFSPFYLPLSKLDSSPGSSPYEKDVLPWNTLRLRTFYGEWVVGSLCWVCPQSPIQHPEMSGHRKTLISLCRGGNLLQR